MDLDNCVFCNDEELKQGLLDETSNFYLRANLFPASPGHCMIISKQHLSCFGEMPDNLDEEYLDLLNRTKERVMEYFSEPIVTEQGIHGQSIRHAHSHIFPSVSEIYDFSERKIARYIPKEIMVTKQEGLHDIKEVFREEGQYVSIEQQGDIYVCHTKDYTGDYRPSRDSVVEASGLTFLLNWKTMSEDQKQTTRNWHAETIEKLKIKN